MNEHKATREEVVEVDGVFLLCRVDKPETGVQDQKPHLTLVLVLNLKQAFCEA